MSVFLILSGLTKITVERHSGCWGIVWRIYFVISPKLLQYKFDYLLLLSLKIPCLLGHTPQQIYEKRNLKEKKGLKKAH